MIRSGSWRHPSAALLLGRLTTGQDHVRPCVALDERLAVRSPLYDTGSAYCDRPTGFTHSTASQTSAQCSSPTDRQQQNPHSV
jgi:hypothetical protein